MAVASDRRIAGSVSGGCVENAVVEGASEVIASGKPRLLRFGVADETAWSVGLACGGSIEVFVELLADEVHDVVREAVLGERAVAVATIVRGPEEEVGRKVAVFRDGGPVGAADPSALDAARAALAEGHSRRFAVGGREIFVDVVLPSPRLVVVGGVHIAIALVTLARSLGFRTILIDPREPFGNAKRFPHADEILSEWPDQAFQRVGLNAGTAVAVLTHDAKLDDPAIADALASPAFYVGALGSSRTREKRRARLRAAGVSEESLDRLHAPIGLDLGGRAPEEIALAIMAEIVAVRNGRSSLA